MLKSPLTIDYSTPEKRIYLLSDLHWDNPKCDLKLLKKHLDKAKEEGADVLLNGDTFCVMQGKSDRRGSKSDIRPEHNTGTYFDSVIETAIEWFLPYADILKFVGYGNHETAILKHHETDLIKRFVVGLNARAGSTIAYGDYSGWIIYRYKRFETESHVYAIKYHHGFGGGGAVTKGTIQHNRMSTFVHSADLIWMGHVHENYELVYQVEYLTRSLNVRTKPVLMIRTSTYKEEYTNGGFHIEGGRPPKPLGGRILTLTFEGSERDNRHLSAKTELI